MANRVVQPFEASGVIAGISPLDRIERAVEKARCCISKRRLQRFFDIPMVPGGGASEEELAGLEKRLGCPLPTEYRLFLSRYRYLVLDEGHNIGGFDHEGLSAGEPLWVSTRHQPGRRFLVFGAYWRYADGDQLMFDLDGPGQPVVAYLHEHGPLIESYAPTFSLALWRLVAEVAGDKA